MLRLALCALLAGVVAIPAATQTTGYTPPGGTGGMGVNNSAGGGWLWMPGMVTSSGNHYSPPVPAARPAQVQVGAIVDSTEGPFIGKIAYADGKVAVVKSPHWALRLPVKAFGARGTACCCRSLLPISTSGEAARRPHQLMRQIR